jgi:hypothetical protein
LTHKPRFPPWSLSALLPILLYWRGLTAWFQREDFALLSLRDLHTSGHNLASLLFAPVAQGTIRTLSERVFYLSFSSFFGLNALPYRIMAFITFAAALLLLSSVCARLTGSPAAGRWAAILWGVNGALAIPLSWTAEYYELLCALFFLLDFWLLLRFVETGERRFYIAQWVTFGAGFGVLELNVVYPALAAVYVLCRAPKILRKILPMFIVSAAYLVVHTVVAPLPAAGPYKLHWDWHIVQTLATYGNWALGPAWLSLVGFRSILFRLILLSALTAGLGSWLIWRLRGRQWATLLFPAWFIIVLLPLLPLREHVSYEYLTVPLIGVAMWGGASVVAGWQARGWRRIATGALLIIYCSVSVSIGTSLTRLFHDRSIRVRDLVYGLATLNTKRAERVMLLTGVSPEAFEYAIYPRALRVAGIRDVYIVPEDKQKVGAISNVTSAEELFIDPVVERAALARDRAVVYDVSRGIRDITAEYRAALGALPAAEPASRIELGGDSYASQLGPTWYPGEGAYRWMPKRASVTLPGPRRSGEKLYLKGFCPAAVLRGGPLAMQVTINDERLPEVWVRQPDAEFSFNFDLPAGATAKPTVIVGIELSRTVHAPPDPRELGLAFISIAVE